MAGEWQEMPFSKAVLVNPPTPLSRGREYPFVDMAALNPGSRCAYSTERRDFEGGGSRFMAGDTLMARITPCLENGKIARYCGHASEPGHGSTEFIVIRGREGLTDTAFAYYLTKWEGVSEYAISQMTGTSGRQRVPTTALDHLIVAVPPVPEQRAIAHILGTLDDKIELNRRMSETLEAMARALFKSWFVDFDPVRAKMEGRWRRGDSLPGLPAHLYDLFPARLVDSELGEIPEGWGVGVLGDVLAQSVDRCTPSEETRSRPYVPIECIAARSLLLSESKPGDEAQSSLTRFRRGDLLFGAMRPYFHKVAIAPFDGTTRTTVFVLQPRQAEDFSYAALLLHDAKTIEYATNHSTGSTIPYAVWQGSLEQMPIVLPPPKVRKYFEQLARPLLTRIPPVFFENRTLAALRDALLPKLISGELRVKDAEKFIGRVV